MANQTITFRKIKLNDQQFNKLCNYINEMPFSEDNKEGFIIEDWDKANITACYILDLPTFEERYDPTQNLIVREQTFRITFVPFTIDNEVGVIEIYGAKRNINRLVQVIGKALNFEVAVEEYEFSPRKILKQLRINGIEYEITRIHVHDFPVYADILGDCNLKVAGLAGIDDIINKYSDKITQIKLGVIYEDNVIPLLINSLGTMRLYIRDSMPEAFINHVKRVVLGE